MCSINLLYELNESAGEYEFTANIFASLLVTEKLYVVVKDEVAVYTTPNTLVATNGGLHQTVKHNDNM